MKDARQNQRGRPPPIRLGGDVPGGTADSDNSRAESIEMMSPNKRLIERIKNRSNRSQNDIDKSRESLSKAKRKEALRQKNSGPQSRDERHDNDGDLIEEEQDVSRNKEEKENLSLPITDILQPMHIFPVDIFRLSRNRENATQPLLYNPYSHPLCFEQSHTTNAYCLCSPFCSTDMLHREPKRREGTWEIENYDHMHGRNGVRHDGADDVDESTHLLDSPARQDRRRNPSSEIDPSVRAIEMTSRHQADIRKVGDCDASFTLELKSPIRREEGLYPGHDSRLIQLLLWSEPVDLPLAKLVSPNVYLSRATQRQLRELVSCYYSHYMIRNMWKRLTAKQDVSELLHMYHRGLNAAESVEWHQLMRCQERGDDRIPGMSLLLKFNESEPTLRVMENFVNENVMQQVHPATSRKFITRHYLPEEENMADQNEHLASSLFGSTSAKNHGVTLKVLAQEICLTNHPYMSEEECLFVELKSLYTEYARLIKSRSVEYLPYRLLSSMTEIEHLVDPHAVELSAEDTQVALIQLYNDALETAVALSEFKASLDNASNSVYSTWRNIQELRKKQGFVSTRAVLVGRRVRQQGVDCDSGAQHWKALHDKLGQLPKLLDLAFGHMHLPEESQHHKHSLSHSDPLTVRQNSIAMKPIDGFEKKQAVHSHVLREVEGTVQYLHEIDSHTLLPPIIFIVENSGTCTPDVQVPPSEIERRRKLRRVKVRAVLKVNGQTLATSSPQLLQWPALKVDISRMFEMRVLREPSEAVFEVYASYEVKNTVMACCSNMFFNDTLVATVGVPLAQRMTQNSKKYGDKRIPAVCYVPVMGWYTFSSQKLMAASKGRGLTITSDNKRSHRFEGALLCGSEYDIAHDQHDKSVALSAPVEGVLGCDLAIVPGQYNSEWRSEAHGRIVGSAVEFTEEKDFFELLPPLNLLDINDPRNDRVVQRKVSGILSGRMKKRDIFQLGGEFVARLHKEKGTSYGHFVRLKACSRIRLLRLRELKPYLFTERIPLSEEAIRTSVLFKNMLIQEDRTAQLTDAHVPNYFQDTPSTCHLYAGTETAGTVVSKKAVDFLARVRDSQTVLSRRARKKKVVTSSVVYERLAPLNDFSLMQLLKVVSIPERKRALKPTPIERVPEALPKRCELLVQVVSARNVPLRVNSQDDDMTVNAARRNRRSGGFGNAESMGGDTVGLLASDIDSQFLKEKKRVSTFVEVEFQGKKVRTTSMDGPAPAWKQSMTLPFMPPHGEFNHSNLEQVDDVVQFTLFDEIIHDDASRGGLLDGVNTLREERKYLGSFCIPFSTILTEKRIEGTFRLNTPPINYGYMSTHSLASTQNVHQPQSAGGILRFLGLGGKGTNSQRKVEEPFYFDENTEKELEWFCCGARNSTYITLMATLDPLLTSSPYMDSDLSMATAFPPDRPLIPRVQFWIAKLKSIGNHTRNRKYTLFGSNSDGLSVLVCRYLKPLQPPPCITSRRACIHAVSLIPFIPDSQAFVGEFDLWCTTKQMLEIMAGDEEEHATTLYNYLYYLSLRESGHRASETKGNGSRNLPFEGYPTDSFVSHEELFLVSGYAVPEGHTTYVLIRKEGRSGHNSNSKGHMADAYLLVNPCTGYVYSAADPNCPIKEIYSLATPYNVWGNVQKASLPKDLNFDIMKPSLWQPLFSDKFRPPVTTISSIQSDIAYYPTHKGPCLEIEKIIQNEIISNFRKWRSKRARPDTAFHPETCAVMTDMLEWLEEWKMFGTLDGQVVGDGKRANASDRAFRSQDIPTNVLVMIEDKAAHRLRNVSRTSTLTGYPVNMAYTDVDAVINAVRSFGVHETKHREVEFVLAVRVFPLFNGLMSLWIFVGTLERDRN